MAPDALLNRIFCHSTAAPPCCFYAKNGTAFKKITAALSRILWTEQKLKAKSQLDTTCISAYHPKKRLKQGHPSPHGRFRPWPLKAAPDPAGRVAAAATGAAGAVAALGAAPAATGRAAREGRGGMGGAELCGTCREGSRLAVGEGDFVGFL